MKTWKSPCVGRKQCAKCDVSGMAEAMKWVSVVTTVVGIMTVPALGGFWIDNLLGTKSVFTILGLVFGFVGGMYGLLNMVKAKAERNESRPGAIEAGSGTRQG